VLRRDIVPSKTSLTLDFGSSEVIVSLLILVGFIFPFESAYACEVGGGDPRPTKQSFDNSVAVFSGTVTNIQNYTVEGYGDWHLVSFKVDRYWKTMNNNNDYEQLILFTSLDGNVCGYEFEKDKTYLVYATKWWHAPNTMYTGLGYGTKPIEDSQGDFAFLGGEGNAPTKQLSLDEQINRVMIQSMPTGQEQETSTRVISIIGVGVAIAGVVAFLSLRRLKDDK
jgi:hypothetical protein